jgi:succinoglycan biosynthesis transport protein ExoP
MIEKAPPPPPRLIPATPPLQLKPADDVHILDRLAVLYRYRYIALSVFVLTTLAIMIQGYTTLQLYQAQGRVLIDSERSTAVPGLQAMEAQYYEDPQAYLNTQFKIIKGRDLTRRVVRKLQLGNYPEFNGTATPARTPLTMLRDLKDRVLGLIKSDKALVEAPKPQEMPDEAGLIDAFLSKVGVVQVPDSRLVDITFQSMEPKLGAEAVNTLMKEYVEQNLAVKVQATEGTLEWLDAELKKQQAKVEESERALAQYRERQNAMSLDDKQNVVLTRYQKLNDDLLTARNAKARAQQQYEQVKNMAPSEADTVPAVANHPAVSSAKAKLLELRRTRTELQAKWGPGHPRMKENATAIEEAERLILTETTRAIQTVKNEFDTAAQAERTLLSAVEASKADVADLGRKSVDYNVMEREAKSNHAVYDTLLQQEKELRVSSNSRANNVRIVDLAEVPKSPMAPAGRRTWLMSIAVGLALAVTVAFGLDYMNDTIKTPEDVNQRLKQPFLGLVPSVRGDKHPLLASSHVPHDFGESFRALRTSLISKYAEPGTKILVVTSAQPLEGKTITAANLAMALAYGGARVLLIDADMRRPGLHRPLRLTNERGLSQVLNGQARVRDVIQRTVDPNLLAITAGKTPPNPSELLSSERMKTLLTNLAHGAFDWILIDTPPVLAVTDAVILAPAVSGVVYVIGAEMTRRRLAERALETILQANPKSVVVVLNKVDFSRNKYYYSRYYGHQYKNYYAGASV